MRKAALSSVSKGRRCLSRRGGAGCPPAGRGCFQGGKHCFWQPQIPTAAPGTLSEGKGQLWRSDAAWGQLSLSTFSVSCRTESPPHPSVPTQRRRKRRRRPLSLCPGSRMHVPALVVPWRCFLIIPGGGLIRRRWCKGVTLERRGENAEEAEGYGALPRSCTSPQHRTGNLWPAVNIGWAVFAYYPSAPGTAGTG